MSLASERYVVLKNGPTVRVEPVELLLDLESRGFRVYTDNGTDVLVSPASKLQPNDVKNLKSWRTHVLALLQYQPPEVQ